MTSPDAPSTRPSAVLRDTRAVLVRELWPVLRDPFSVVFSLLQPLVFLAFFTPLLAGMTGAPLGDQLQWFVPGIIVMSTLFGTAMAGSNLLAEMQSGSHERMLVTPVSRSALMIGRALKEMVPLSVQAVVLTGVAAVFGFRPHPPGMALGLVLLAVFGIGLGALSYSLGIASRNRDWMFWAVQQGLLFPLMILSGMLLPLESAPRWLQVLSSVNPLTYLVGAERALFNGLLTDPTVWQGALAAVGVATLGLVVGVRMMRRSV
ncbi:ABC transporter permease [Cellulomonas bogoriensis]|uniref:Transport permease protein n=1 Tax=Cellulomonas bogoriensis 69B4 = DSM 16987 TaxID=1386082 RepID=A0A0A0BZI6_9CELL|nr:ABC transporter permease [Cellulomonas bogoriensis]KGM13788.1 multidrug ABC transporter permease [Cellulomonas bogoriensis 69B4 = DSM 16987]